MSKYMMRNSRLCYIYWYIHTIIGVLWEARKGGRDGN